jgi:hypothetical protein
MLHFDSVTPNGQLIPLSIEMDGEAQEVFKIANQKCGFIGGSCKVNYPAMNYVPTYCSGPFYG